MDGISIRRIEHKSKIFGAYVEPNDAGVFLKAYCVDGLSLSASARLAGIDPGVAARMVRNGHLRSARDTKRLVDRTRVWKEGRRRFNSPNGKWTDAIQQIVAAKTDSIEIYLGCVPTRADCNKLRAMLGITKATNMFRWSVRPSQADAESFTVRRIGAFDGISLSESLDADRATRDAINTRAEMKLSEETERITRAIRKELAKPFTRERDAKVGKLCDDLSAAAIKARRFPPRANQATEPTP